MITKKILRWTLPLLVLPALLCTTLLQRALENRRQVGWSDVDLEEMSIDAIVFDAQGRAWVSAIKDGANAFDGENWTTYKADGNGLSLTWINDLALDDQERVWIATPNGLSIFDDGRWTTHTVETAEMKSKMAFDRQGRVWLYKGAPGLSVFDGQTWTTYTTDNSGLVSDRVTTVAFDNQNRAWIGTRNGLSVFDGEAWTTYTAENSDLAHNHIFALSFDEQNKAWIGAEGALDVFDGQAWLVPFDYSKGFRVFSDGRWLEYTTENSALPNRKVTTLAADHEGRIWVGTGKGLRAVRPAEAQPITEGVVLVLKFLAHGGHAFLPIVLAGLWLGILLDALRGVSTGLAVGLAVASCGFLTASSNIFILADVVMVTGIVGGLLGSRMFGQEFAAPSSSEEEAAPSSKSDITGVLGGGLSALGCAGLAVVGIVGYSVCLLVTMFVLAYGFGVGMQ